MKKNLSLKSCVFFALMTILACKENSKQQEKVAFTPSYTTSLDYNRTVMQILDQSPVYNSFLKLVNAVEYFDEISALDDVMVFVPTDEAFGPSKGLINELSAPENLPVLREIIDYHIVQADLDVDNVLAQLEIQEGPLRLKTRNGGMIALSLNQGKLQILDEKTNISYVGKSSIRGTNGIVYTINRVMQPNSQVPSNPNTAMAQNP